MAASSTPDYIVGTAPPLTPGSNEESVVTFSSPFNNNISTFDDENSSTDLTFCIPGMEKPLCLHWMCLGARSETINSVLKGERNSYARFDPVSRCVNWMHEDAVSDVTYRNVLIKWLRFCYGEDQSFSANECPVALAVLSQLQLRNTQEGGNDFRTMMEQSMVETARKNAEIGAEMLNACLRELRMKETEALKKDAEDDMAKMLDEYDRAADQKAKEQKAKEEEIRKKEFQEKMTEIDKRRKSLYTC